MKVLPIVMAMMLAVSVAACERKEVKKETPKAVKTERVVVDKAGSGEVSLKSLDARVSDIERRMANARKQYAKDRELLEQRLNGR